MNYTHPCIHVDIGKGWYYLRGYIFWSLFWTPRELRIIFQQRYCKDIILNSKHILQDMEFTKDFYEEGRSNNVNLYM
jgi:hypothetical protein